MLVLFGTDQRLVAGNAGKYVCGERNSHLYIKMVNGIVCTQINCRQVGVRCSVG